MDVTTKKVYFETKNVVRARQEVPYRLQVFGDTNDSPVCFVGFCLPDTWLWDKSMWWFNIGYSDPTFDVLAALRYWFFGCGYTFWVLDR